MHDSGYTFSVKIQHNSSSYASFKHACRYTHNYGTGTFSIIPLSTFQTYIHYEMLILTFFHSDGETVHEWYVMAPKGGQYMSHIYIFLNFHKLSTSNFVDFLIILLVLCLKNNNSLFKIE